MASAPVVPEEIARLLGEAAEWRLLGLLFEYPSEAWRRRLEALQPDLLSGDLRALAAEALEHASPGLHIALFGPAGAVPAREVSYRGGIQPGYLLAELAAYYEAFGYRPDAGEPDDHLAVTLGFVSYLKLKQAYAIAEGNPEHARIAAEAAANFLKDHLAVCAGPAARALENFAPGYLAAAGRIVLAHAGPPPPREPWSGDCDSGELTCGSMPPDAGLTQIQT